MARPCSGLARGCSSHTPAPSWGSQMPLPAGVVAVTPPALDISHSSLWGTSALWKKPRTRRAHPARCSHDPVFSRVSWFPHMLWARKQALGSHSFWSLRSQREA